MRVMHRVAIFERRTSPRAVVSGRTVVSGRVGPAPPAISPAATVGWPVQPSSATPSPPTVGWRLGVLRRVEAMEAELDIYEQQLVTGATGARLRSTLDAAKTACGTRPSTLREGWSGCRVERAWQRVHEARALMPVIAPASELPRLRTFAKDAAAAGLPATDGRRVAIETDALGTRLAAGAPQDGDRWLISDTIRGAYERADERFIALRAWRNRIYLTALGVVATLVGLCLALTRWPAVVPLCFEQASSAEPAPGAAPPTVPLCPTGLQAAGSTSTSRDVLVVVVAGLLGALLVAVAAIRKGSPSTSTYRLTPALTAMRLPLGGITAVVGLLLAQGATKIGIAPIASQAELLIAAVVLGIAQEPITNLLEARARAVQDAANDSGTSETDKSG
ncbi:hypothetical protein BH11ACT1_BH11ACT1_12330 [soil metagenome]